MPDRAAICTGASRGIGRAIAEALAEEGYALTISARKPDTLEEAAAAFRDKGHDVEAVAGNMADEEAIKNVVERHRARFGRLDVLVNNAGVGIGAAVDEHQAKFIDLQLAVNIRAIVLLYRESAQMLRAAGAEHRNAVVINMSSFAGKSGQPWLSVYSATKAAVIGFSQATQKEVSTQGIQVTALCPGFVDTPMTDYVRDQVSAEEMIRPEDIAESVRFLLRTSPACLVPEIVFTRPDELPGAVA